MTPEIPRGSRLFAHDMRTLSLFAALVFATGCVTSCTTAGAPGDSSAETAGGPLQTRKVADGGFAATAEGPQAVAVTDIDSYHRTWQSLVQEKHPPAIDFGNESALFLFAGEKNTGGYWIELKGVTLEGETLVVDAVVHRPDPAALVLQVITKPYLVAAVNTKAFRAVRWTPGPPQ
jgi:hypothetical protein